MSAPYPIELAERLVRMFSFVGDTVLDPFMGTGTTSLAAAKWGRNSMGVEVDPHTFDLAARRIERETPRLITHREIVLHRKGRSDTWSLRGAFSAFRRERSAAGRGNPEMLGQIQNLDCFPPRPLGARG
ncbi:MAG: site-specific DNA-methyltransferase [Thiobacillaceae bacterium]